MKAAVIHGPKKVTYDTVDDPSIKDDRDIILKVTATAICGSDLHIYTGGIPQPRPMVLDDQSFTPIINQNKIVFFGSGSSKFKGLVQNDNASFADVHYNAGHLSQLAQAAFQAASFTDVAYAEPVYLKEFYTHTRK